MQAEMLILRGVHVLGGIFWVGSALFMAFMLMPALASAGPAAGAVMGAMQRRRLFLVLPIVAILTILSGIRLMQITSGGFDQSYFESPTGRVFAWGASFGIAALVFGLVVGRPLAAKMGRLAVMPAPTSPEEQAARGAERAALQRRAAVMGIVNVGLLLAAAIAMATARYV